MKLSADCRRLLRNLTDAIDAPSASPDFVRHDFSRHLATCDACRQHVEHARALGRILRAVPALPCPGASEQVLDAYLADREHAIGGSLRAALAMGAAPVPLLDHAGLPATSAELIARLPAEQTSSPAPRLGQVLRAGLSPVPVPGWVWTRVRAEIADVRRELADVDRGRGAPPATATVAGEHASTDGMAASASAGSARRRGGWLHGLLASAAAAALVVWLQRAAGSPAVLRAQPIDVVEPLDASLLPETLMLRMLDGASSAHPLPRDADSAPDTQTGSRKPAGGRKQ